MASIVVSDTETYSTTGTWSLWSPASAGPGVYSALITLDGPLSGNTVEFQWAVTLTGSDPRPPAWAYTPADEDSAILSPPVPISDATWDELRVVVTVVGGSIDVHYQIVKVAGLTGP